MAKIAVVGSLNMDLVIRASHLPAPGETIIGHDFLTAPGGKGANQAVGAARLDAAVVMVGRVGADDFGRVLRERLVAAGVDTTYVVTDQNASTGVAVIAVEDSGQNSIIVASGANAAVSCADVDAARTALLSAQVLVLQLEIPLVVVTHAIRLARQTAIPVILNPAPAQPLPAAMLSLVDVLVPNETEAARLTGTPIDDWTGARRAAYIMRERGARVVVITLGERGAWVATPDGARAVPAFPVRAVDATAAGDAFVAALSVALAGGRTLDSALQEASAAGALACTRLGAQPSLPTRAELDRFLMEHP